MLFLYLFACFGLLAFAPDTNASYMCTGIHTWFNATYGNSTQTLLHYETDLLYSGTPAGYETLNIINPSVYSYNSSYNVFGLQQESYGQDEIFSCRNTTSLYNCTLIFADGDGSFDIWISLGSAYDYLPTVDVGYFRGAVFWEIGLVLTPDDSCINFFDFDGKFPGYNTFGEYCCNRWEQLPEAPPADNTCVEFLSNVEYYNQSMSLANLTMLYYITPGVQITIMGVNFTTSLPYSLQYDHSVNYAFQDCQGTTDSPASSCVAQIDFNDAVYAFYADVTGAGSGTWHAIAGAVEYRFGQLMRNGSDPFTPQNNCFQYSFDASVGGSKAFDKAVLSRSNFCCTKWKNPVASTTPSIPPPLTTTKPSGKIYHVSLQIANTTNFNQNTLATLNATLQVSASKYIFTVTSYHSFMKSNYHVYIFANQFQTEDCIGSGKKVCHLSQTNGQSYPWFLSTSFAPDGFQLFTTSAQNEALTIPELSSNEKCYFVVNPYNYAYPPMYVQASICL
jgi:hypothetical protein